MNKVSFSLLVSILPIVSTLSIAQNVQKDAVLFENTGSIIARTQNGFVRGMLEPGNLAIFSGIPYAAPPVGDLRWKQPVNANNWSDTLTTTAYGRSCPQPSKDNDPTSEDCLYLNVFTAADPLNNS